MKQKPRTRLQRGCLIALAAMAVLFSVLMGISKSNPGVYFRDTRLKVASLEDRTVYTGKMDGQAFAITVRPGPGRLTYVETAAGETDFCCSWPSC